MSECPDFPERCGVSSPRQRPLSATERLQWEDRVGDTAQVCTYCGVIYKRRWGRVSRAGFISEMAGYGVRHVAEGHGGTYA